MLPTFRENMGCLSLSLKWTLFWIYMIVIPLAWIQAASGQARNTSSHTCSPFCVQSTEATCNKDSGECFLGCLDGYAGSSCNIQCCPNCKNCTLEQGNITSLVCHQCVDSYYQSGGGCFPCSDTCQDKDCDVYGFCKNGCILPVLSGPTCSETCSEGCVARECNQTGKCWNGCVDGYWGSSCSAVCHKNCIKPTVVGLRTCDESSGDCLHGCANETYWGKDCSNECSSTCLNQRCDYETGNCIDGCIGEFQGPRCLETIETRDKNEIIVIAVGVSVGVVVVIIAVIVICVCFRKRRKSIV